MKGIAMQLSMPSSIVSKFGVMVIAITIGTVVASPGPAQAEYRGLTPIASTVSTVSVRTPSPQARQTLDRLQAALPSDAPKAAGPFHVINEYSQKCLNVWNASADNYAQIIQYTCESSMPNDVWWFQLVNESENSPYYLINDYSGRCLNVWNASTADYALVIQYTCGSGLQNDQWLVTDYGVESFRLQNRHSLKCLNVNNASTADYALLIQYTCGSSLPNDFWQLG
jgi:hypothetical protein